MKNYNYYSLLSVNTSATTNEINRNYRKLSMLYHPDRQETKEAKERAQEQFIALSNAKNVLSDPMKRKIYDIYGEEGLRNGFTFETTMNFTTDDGSRTFSSTSFTSFNMNDLEDFLGTASASKRQKTNFGGYHSRPTTLKLSKAKDIVYHLYVSLKELFLCKTKRIKLTRQVLTFDGLPVKKDEFLSFILTPGTREGSYVRFKEVGDQLPGYIPADIVFYIHEKSHPLFRRNGCNLEYTVILSLKEALIGTHICIPTLDNRKLNINIPPIESTEFVFVVKGEGLPRTANTRGDLHLKFIVNFPTNLSIEQIEAIL